MHVTKSANGSLYVFLACLPPLVLITLLVGIIVVLTVWFFECYVRDAISLPSHAP